MKRHITPQVPLVPLALTALLIGGCAMFQRVPTRLDGESDESYDARVATYDADVAKARADLKLAAGAITPLVPAPFNALIPLGLTVLEVIGLFTSGRKPTPMPTPPS